MAFTEFQRTVCRLIARQRIESGVSYIAGGVALNTLTGSPRMSQDIDIFHDVRESVVTSWNADRETLGKAGFVVRPLRERDTFVEAIVSTTTESSFMKALFVERGPRFGPSDSGLFGLPDGQRVERSCPPRWK